MAHGGPRALIEWCRKDHLASGTNLLLVVDQFEELFRYQDYAGRDEAEAFVSLLLESRRPIEVENPQMAEFPIFVTITMRSEYLGACALIEGLAEAINEGTYLTPRMSRQQCRDAIVGPARVCGVEIEDSLVAKILNDLVNFAPWEEGSAADQLSRLARRADQLPLMQHALNQMWQRARTTRKLGEKITLTIGDYRGLEKELDDHADEVLESLDSNAKPIAEAVFRAVTSGTTVADATRRPTKYGDLVEICGGERVRNAVAAVISAFGPEGCNFLTSDSQLTGSQPPSDRAWIDISHESLIRQWRRLSEWLAREAKTTHEWQRLDDEARRYYTPERGDSGALLSMRRLLGAIRLRKETNPTLAWAKRYRIDYARVRSYLTRSLVVACAGATLIGSVAIAAAGVMIYYKPWESAKLRALNAQLQTEHDSVIKQGDSIVNLSNNLIGKHRTEKRKMLNGRPTTPGLNKGQEGGAGSSTEDSPDSVELRMFREHSRELAAMGSAIEQLFNDLSKVEPNNIKLVRSHMVTMALLSVLSDDPDQARQERKAVNDIAATMSKMDLDIDSVKTVYVSMSLLAIALTDERHYDDALTALKWVQSVLSSFTGGAPEKQDLALAHGWTADVLERTCDIDDTIGRVDQAISACRLGLDAVANEPAKDNWKSIGNIHYILSGIYSRQADAEVEKRKAGALRGRAIAELQQSVQAAYDDFKSVFKQYLADIQESPEHWRATLDKLLVWAREPSQQRIKNWLAEPDPAFALARSDWIASRLNDLANLYDSANNLQEERAAYLLRFIYRDGLARSEDIVAKAQEIRRRINDLKSKVATLRNEGQFEEALAQETNANELQESQSMLLNYDRELAMRQLARAMRDIGYLEGATPRQGEPDREPASAEKLFESCADDLMSGLADQGDAIPVNQQTAGLCHFGLGWLETQQARRCKAPAADAINTCKLNFFKNARDAYERSKNYLERAYEHAPLVDVAHDLINSLAGLAHRIDEVSSLETPNDIQARKKAIAEAAKYSERAAVVAQAAYDLCQSATVDCAQPIDDLARRSGFHAWYVLRLGETEAAKKFAEAAIRVNNENPRKPGDLDQLELAINLAHARLFNDEFDSAKDIYVAVGTANFDGLSGLSLIKEDFAELRTLGVVHPGMCKISELLDDNDFAKATCTP